MDSRIFFWILWTLELHIISRGWTWKIAPFPLDDPFRREQSKANLCPFGETSCTIQCASRKFDKPVCKGNFCHCIRHSVTAFTSDPSLCETNCDLHCQRKMATQKGTCDRKGNCLCHDPEDKVIIPNGKCIVPSSYCKKQCHSKYQMGHNSCVDELCVCAKGLKNGDRRLKILDFNAEYCPVPKSYCGYRCNMAKFSTGLCRENQCVCSGSKYGSSEDYFTFDVSVDDGHCEECKQRCSNTPQGTGRCIGNQCVCMNLGIFQVQTGGEPQKDCEIPTSYCQRLCSRRQYHDNAVCESGYRCLCAEGKKMMKVDFLKGKCYSEELNKCDRYCSATVGRVASGFCNRGDCLCIGGPEQNAKPKPLAFMCLTSPPKPFQSFCKVI